MDTIINQADLSDEDDDSDLLNDSVDENDIVQVEDDIEPRILLAPEDNQDFSRDWTLHDPPLEPLFFVGEPGPRFPLKQETLDNVVSLFFPETFFSLLAEKTNKYHSQTAIQIDKPSKSPPWTDVTFAEMRQFFALLLIMTQVRKKVMKDYWSSNILMETPIFPRTMSRNRFFEMLTYLRFEDDTVETESENYFAKIQNLIHYFVQTFESVYKPKQDLVIEENIVGFKKKIPFKIKWQSGKSLNSPPTAGILSRMLCDAETGYICNLKLYIGRKDNMENVVIDLLDGYTNLGHHLYASEAYNGVPLAEKLLKLGTRICGPVKKVRGFPANLGNAELEQSKCKYLRKGDVLAQVWKNEQNEDIRIVSTIHGSGMRKVFRKSTGVVGLKPKSLCDYHRIKKTNRFSNYLILHPLLQRTREWSKKIALYLINCALMNSFIVYNSLESTVKCRFEDYILQVADRWLQVVYPVVKMEIDPLASMSDRPYTSKGRNKISDPPDRLSGNMRVHKLDRMINGKSGRLLRQRCRVCLAKRLRRDTVYMCVSCNIALHIGDCFNDYHTKKDYSE